VSPTIGIDAACTKSRLAGFSAASALRDHREFGDSARTQVEDVGEDGIAWLETGHAATDLGHHPSQIAAQRGRKLEMQDRFEYSRQDHVVDRVHARSVDLYQQFVGLQRGAGKVGEPDPGRLAIAFEGECFHGLIFHLWPFILIGADQSVRKSRTAGTKARWC
jgi:hypothetical protein